VPVLSSVRCMIVKSETQVEIALELCISSLLLLLKGAVRLPIHLDEDVPWSQLQMTTSVRVAADHESCPRIGNVGCGTGQGSGR
jgi:hypothetical protein